MNVVVHKAKHPQLDEYIHSAVNGLLPFIHKVLFLSCSINMQNIPFMVDFLEALSLPLCVCVCVFD